MSTDPKVDRNLASLVEITDAILRGEFDHSVEINAEGLLSTLAQRINSMIINMRSAEMPLTSAGDQAPNMADRAKNVVELMKQTAGNVLDRADSLSDLADELEGTLQKMAPHSSPDISEAAQNTLETMKEAIFDIIASQSYQDVARQKLEKIVLDLNQVRDWLIDALVILNIRKDTSPENIQTKTEKLREINEPTTPENSKQDLVDDLLAEFGF